VVCSLNQHLQRSKHNQSRQATYTEKKESNKARNRKGKREGSIGRDQRERERERDRERGKKKKEKEREGEVEERKREIEGEEEERKRERVNEHVFVSCCSTVLCL
jgi:hypothetical protein